MFSAYSAKFLDGNFTVIWGINAIFKSFIADSQKKKKKKRLFQRGMEKYCLFFTSNNTVLTVSKGL